MNSTPLSSLRWLVLVTALSTLLAAMVVAHDSPPSRPARAQSAPSASIHLPLAMMGAARSAMPIVATARPATATTVAPVETATSTEPPPSAVPTEAPTQAPTLPPTAPPTATATASPSATATPALICENLVANGDFEGGARDWTLVVTTQEQDLRRAIIRRSEGPIAPHGGETYAFLGGLDDTSFSLTSRRLPRFETEGIVRATLSYWAALITEEQPDRRPGDRMRAYVDAGRRTYLEDAARSEDDLQPERTWQHVEADVTQLLDRGAQSVGIELVTDRGRLSWFYLDDIRLEICRAE